MKIERSFDKIAKVVREIRTTREIGRTILSQSELSHLLGYKNGQFISNIERALCCMPLKKILEFARIYSIDPEVISKAILEDHKVTLARATRLPDLPIIDTGVSGEQV